jgi:hypothetical protein
VPVVYNIRAQCRQRLDQFWEAGIGLAEGRNRALQVVNLAKRFVDLPMPQRPLDIIGDSV